MTAFLLRAQLILIVNARRTAFDVGLKYVFFVFIEFIGILTCFQGYYCFGCFRIGGLVFILSPPKTTNKERKQEERG